MTLPRDFNTLPLRLSDEALAKIIFEARMTVHGIPSSSRDVANRLSRFNELYEAMPIKPDIPALMYRDPVTGSAGWSAIGNSLVVGRSPKPISNASGSVLTIHDQEMSRQHFEIVLTSEGFYLLNDLKSLNGTHLDGIRHDTAILIGGSHIEAGNTSFIFTGV